jgi:hypothetical protein
VCKGLLSYSKMLSTVYHNSDAALRLQVLLAAAVTSILTAAEI